MSLQKTAITKGNAYLDATPHPHGFLYYPMTGTWTYSTTGGRHFLTGTGGNAINELLYGSLLDGAPGSTSPAPIAPFFDYIFDVGGSITKVIAVLTDNLIEVTSGVISGAGATLSATTSKTGCPRRMIFTPADNTNFVDINFPEGTRQSWTSNAPIVEDGYDSTLTPFVTTTSGVVGYSATY